ncbi:MAG: hypothetical protein AB7G23_00655 [Vicinamibacterales bacterium]
MSVKRFVWMLVALPLWMAAPAQAQQAPFNPFIPNPTPGCTSDPAEMEANKKVAIAFFMTTGDERVALADPTYIQHNPAFIKGAREAKMSDYEYFKSRFGGPPAARGGGGGGRQGGAGPQPPAAAPYEWVMAECDIVFALRKANVQDPTAAPGTFYEQFRFDAFRIRNGKLVEHWDMGQINPPAPGRGGQ